MPALLVADYSRRDTRKQNKEKGKKKFGLPPVKF